MLDANTIAKWIHEVAKPCGYRRKGKSYWLKFTEECLLFINLQKDTPFNYLNLCVLILSLNPELTYESFKWNYDVRKRPDEELGELLDLSHEMDIIEREEQFKEILLTILIPQLEAFGTIEGIKQNVGLEKSGFTASGFPTLRLLGLPLSPRYTYNAVGILGQDGSKEILMYWLWERDAATDEVRNVDTVYTLEEAEQWLKKNESA